MSPMRTWLLVLVCGCSYEPGTYPPDGGTAGDQVTLVDDTAADFGAAETLDAVAIDPRGALEPVAYALNGLRARAYDGQHVSGTTASWQEIEQAVSGATRRGAAYQQVPPDGGWGSTHPAGLGLTSTNDDFTVLYDGELRVPPGDHTIEFDADDAGALELDTGGGFADFTIDASGGAKAVQVHLDQERWVGVHAAVADGGGNAKLAIRLDSTPITADQLRARVTDDRGLVASVYVTTGGSLTLAGMALVDSADVDFGMTAPPYDLTTSTTYTVRFTGQLYIASDGMYTLTATPDAKDSASVYLDRHFVARQPMLQGHPTAATLPLTAGWHMLDIELDGSQLNFFGQPDPRAVTLAVTLAAGDGPAMPLTSADVRPAVASGYLALTSTPLTLLADAGQADGVTKLPLPAPAPSFMKGTVESELVGYVLQNATPSDYAVVFDSGVAQLAIPPTAILVAVFGDETAAGQPVPAADEWTLTFTDSVPGGGSNPSASGFAYVTLHGGPLLPFAPELTYVSAPRQLDGIRGFGALRVLGDLAGTTLAIAVRTADSAEALATAPWVEVENGAIPTGPPAPLFQYRLVVTGDGWSYPSIDRVELDYTR